jgi:hypothetical protein
MEQEKMDRLNKEALEILGYENAPDNFTALVMERIQNETVHAPGKDKPIIGRWGWLLIITVIVLLMLGFWFSSASQSPGNGLLADSFINDWWSRYIHPLLNTIIANGGQFGIVVLIGMTATFMLFADSLIGNKLKSRISYN